MIVNNSISTTSAGYHVTLRSYIVGFMASLSLTLFAYWLVVIANVAPSTAIIMISSLAITQFIVQALLFLHVAAGPRSQLKIILFVAMVIVVTILVGGSLWIMGHLNYHMMSSPNAMLKYMTSQDGL